MNAQRPLAEEEIKQIEVKGRSDLAAQFMEALEDSSQSPEETVERVRDMATYFTTILRIEPKTSGQAVDMAARKEMADEIRDLLTPDEAPAEKVKKVRRFVEGLITAA